MRSKLLALLMGFGLAATIAPAMACTFSDSAQSTPTTSQQDGGSAADRCAAGGGAKRLELTLALVSADYP